MSSWTRSPTTVIEAAPGSGQLVFDRFELLVEDGPDKGTSHAYGQEIVQVGTAPVNDLVVTDRTVSRFHLRIETTGGSFRLVDLGSTNGTFLGGFRVESAIIDAAATIELGNTKLRLRPLGEKATLELPACDHMGNLIGSSPKMRQLYALLERVAAADIPVIIEGETGTGKDLVARLLHQLSRRNQEAFEVLDCGAIPDTLIESELFGHVKGAFTSADRDRAGIFERASGGTVFLDELGELKLALQPKLLRVLEAGEVRRVGDGKPIRVDVRVVAATHCSLSDLVNNNLFREDLYYRLAGCRVELPPLRERREDIPLLVDFFLRTLRGGASQKGLTVIAPETIEELQRYSWPGNVRQLKNAVERLAVMGSIDISTLHRDPGHDLDIGPGGAPGMTMRDAKDDFERRYLAQLMQTHQGDLQAAAESAEIHPKSLARLLRRHAIGR